LLKGEVLDKDLISRSKKMSEQIQLVSEVMNFIKHRSAFVTLMQDGKEITQRAKDIFADKTILSKMSLEDANRIAFLASFELLSN
jgi:hypothetical protein